MKWKFLILKILKYQIDCKELRRTFQKWYADKNYEWINLITDVCWILWGHCFVVMVWMGCHFSSRHGNTNFVTNFCWCKSLALLVKLSHCLELESQNIGAYFQYTVSAPCLLPKLRARTYFSFSCPSFLQPCSSVMPVKDYTPSVFLSPK